jgi:hypothetical protein
VTLLLLLVVCIAAHPEVIVLLLLLMALTARWPGALVSELTLLLKCAISGAFHSEFSAPEVDKSA